MKYCLTFLLIYFLLSQSNPLHSQNTDGESMQQEVSEIYDNLINAIGNFSLPAPGLEITNTKEYVAKYNPQSNTILFEAEAYKLFRHSTDDHKSAIAYILAHELAHRYKEHGWAKNYGSQYVGIEVWEKIKQDGVSNEQRQVDETEADLFAGFYAHIAGYPALNVAPEALHLIYNHYDLPKNLKGYPTLDERIVISARTRERLASLIPVFDVANLALVTSNPDVAILCLEKILNSNFSSREIYNNLGVCYLQKAIARLSREELPYIYPVEFDGESRLQTVAERSVSNVQQKEAGGFITKSLDCFKRALALDERYAPAYLNSACSYEILNNYDEANYYLMKYEKAGADAYRIMLNATILKGVMEARRGYSKEAGEYWGDAICKGNNIAEFNLSILHNDQLEKKARNTSEQIEGVNIESAFVVFTKPPVEHLEIEEGLKISIKKYPESKIYKLQGKGIHFIQETTSTTGMITNKGVTTGDPDFKVVQLYGAPNNVMISGNREYFLYPEHKLAFKLKDDRVSGWIVYHSIR